MSTNFQEDVRIIGDLTVIGSIDPPRARTELELESLAVHPINLADFRVWNAAGTVLPGTPASDDLGISHGTWGTHAWKLTTGDLKNTTTTMYGRVMFALPPEYVAGETVKIRISGGMETTVASASTTVDVELYKSDRDGTIGGSDLCATAAQSINSLTFADKDFTITSTALLPGDTLDMRIAVTVTDSATVTAVIATLGAIELLCDIRG